MRREQPHKHKDTRLRDTIRRGSVKKAEHSTVAVLHPRGLIRRGGSGLSVEDQERINALPHVYVCDDCGTMVDSQFKQNHVRWCCHLPSERAQRRAR